ncbi:MAG: HupE/UreJ family protein, partial [Burkholderiales bacterium]|nr:HupE/UreJ family protein [Burkholderiales bacterium]
MTRALAALLLVLAYLVLAHSAHAHKPSDSYLTIAVAEDTISGQWDIALRDLDYAIGLDSDDDGTITWGELREQHDEIAAYAAARLKISGDGGACPLRIGEQLVDNHSDGAYTVLKFAASCPAAPQKLAVSYALFFDLDPQHRGLLRLAARNATGSAVFSPETASQNFVLSDISRWRQFFDFGREGVWHIWIGFDHILFLVALLLPAVLCRDQKRWLAVQRFRLAFMDVFKIVTAFTIAHSITLSLAALGVLALPSRL